ncbi:hypothetical protein [Amycolatopsis sp. FDAARGOS 1241]|uniref:hypothetical protein n=1 Tax=Amycolatopsis sp. FDAARGOS 1241 TaxID=2778070 RepID=UPI00194ECF70|nr:hypothetical protein [Amycolatopsis sp. FDAARGOS 1241]QRP48247.1 hypothetical protein I6J71_10415 [Amycolatopsis sp. FDAARGOS 1241]
MRDAVALFWLYGPDVLADDARSVMDVSREVMALINEPGDGAHRGPEPPDALRAAAERFNEELTKFSAESRQHVV